MYKCPYLYMCVCVCVEQVENSSAVENTLHKKSTQRRRKEEG